MQNLHISKLLQNLLPKHGDIHRIYADNISATFIFTCKGVLKYLGIDPTKKPDKPLEKPSDILKKGDKGIAVYAMKQMLRLLKDKGKIKAGVDNDNIFGGGTETALKEVQKLAGIGQDGKFGTKTADAMYKLLK